MTFTFSEAPTVFTLADTSAVGGSLSNLNGSGTSYTATFTAATGTDISNASVSVTAGSWQEANGNPGSGGSTSPFIVDTVTPTVAVAINNNDVNAANPTGLVTFTFSEAPAAFATLSRHQRGWRSRCPISAGSGTSYTATFTGAAGGTEAISNAVGFRYRRKLAGSQRQSMGSSGSTSPFTVDTVASTVSSIVASPNSGDKNTGNTS